MKKILIAILAFSAFALSGCKCAKKSETVVSGIDSSVADSLSKSAKFETISASLADATIEVSANTRLQQIDFVDSGGEMRVDSNGSISISGVRSADLSLMSNSLSNRDFETRQKATSEIAQLLSEHSDVILMSSLSKNEKSPSNSSMAYCTWLLLIVFLTILSSLILLWRKLKQ